MMNKTLKELGLGLRQKEFSSVELTQEYVRRAQTLNATINAFITFDEEQSLGQARAADELLAKGSGHAVTGIPIAH